MDVNEIRIPEIDPAIPVEPDFFGNGFEHPRNSNVDSLQPASAENITNILSVGGIGISGLNDDDLSEFKEFFVSLEPKRDEEKLGLEKEQLDEENLALETEQGDDSVNKEKCVDEPHFEKKDETVKQNQKEFNESNEDESIKSQSSGPNTPDSRTSAAVVRLFSLPSLPKLESKRISITRESPSKQNLPTPPRVTRGRLNDSIRETRSKRKLDNEVDECSGSQSTSRRVRQVRKGKAVGNVREEDDAIDSNQEEKPSDGDDDSDYEIENNSNDDDLGDSEDLFEPVVKKRKIKTKNYWTSDDGTSYFKDSDGETHTLKSFSIALMRVDSNIKNANANEAYRHSSVLLEVCIDNFLSAKEAVNGGANRIELCSSLAEGGLTPSTGFLQHVKENFENVPIFVMIRPRGGDFLYSEDEIEVMCRDISYYKQMGADGFVFGVLTKDCKVDEKNCKLLLQTAFPLPCTFHRAFDRVTNPYAALETIIDIGFARILTSGQSATALAGSSMLKRLVETADDRIIIMAGCGITERNVSEILRKTGVKEVHGSASKIIPSIMCLPSTSKSNRRGYKPSAVKMGVSDDSVLKVTDSSMVKQMIKTITRVSQ